MGILSKLGSMLKKLLNKLISAIKKILKKVFSNWGILVALFVIACIFFPALLPALLTMVGVPAGITTAIGGALTSLATAGWMYQAAVAAGAAFLIAPDGAKKLATKVSDAAGNAAGAVGDTAGAVVGGGLGGFVGGLTDSPVGKWLLIGGGVLGALWLLGSLGGDDGKEDSRRLAYDPSLEDGDVASLDADFNKPETYALPSRPASIAVDDFQEPVSG